MNSDKKNISIKDLAKMAGVSTATISRVINDVPGCIVSRPKREKILKIAQKVGYRPNRSARLFSRGNNRCESIGVVISGTSLQNFTWRSTASFSIEYIQGISEALNEINHTMSFVVTPTGNTEDFLRREYLSEKKVDGLIIFGGEKELSMASEFEKNGMPVVSFDVKTAPLFNVPLLLFDPEPGIREAVEAVEARKHKKAGIVHTGDNKGGMPERAMLFERLCTDKGIEIGGKRCISASDETESYLSTKELIEKNPDITCIFYTSDLFAMLGIRALLSMGLRVPDDVSVIGYDDAPYSINSPVPLSTIKLPRKKIGASAVKLLFGIINGETPPSRFVLPCQWIQRESLGNNKSMV
ncbi:MAG: hypothetical protein A2017_21750 [Lentisphaerae bacterium GWF2_44_16]|nr:MAG: hypothetical protein A2017_21750 [Lentisphaerae bacterium GWF2_44_16]